MTVSPDINLALSLEAVFQLNFPLANEIQALAGRLVSCGTVNFSVPPSSSMIHPEIFSCASPLLYSSIYCVAPEGCI